MTYTYPVSDPVALAAKLKAEGGPAIDPTQTSGSLPPEHGVKLTWLLQSGNIQIIVASKPFFISYDQIKNGLDHFFV